MLKSSRWTTTNVHHQRVTMWTRFKMNSHDKGRSLLDFARRTARHVRFGRAPQYQCIRNFTYFDASLAKRGALDRLSLSPRSWGNCHSSIERTAHTCFIAALVAATGLVVAELDMVSVYVMESSRRVVSVECPSLHSVSRDLFPSPRMQCRVAGNPL